MGCRSAIFAERNAKPAKHPFGLFFRFQVLSCNFISLKVSSLLASPLQIRRIKKKGGNKDEQKARNVDIGRDLHHHQRNSHDSAGRAGREDERADPANQDSAEAADQGSAAPPGWVLLGPVAEGLRNRTEEGKYLWPWRRYGQ
jgi:hypothetical protein